MQNKLQTKVITVRLSKEEHEALKNVAHDRRLSLNQLCVWQLNKLLPKADGDKTTYEVLVELCDEQSQNGLVCIVQENKLWLNDWCFTLVEANYSEHWAKYLVAHAEKKEPPKVPTVRCRLSFIDPIDFTCCCITLTSEGNTDAEA